MIDPYQIIIILLCLLFSAFFSGIEIAFISADKLHIELLFQKGQISGKILSYFQKHKSRFIATTLVGNNLALVVYGIFMALLIEPLLVSWLPEWLQEDTILLILQTLISTTIVLITAEFIPKSLFLINPDFLLSLFALPMMIIFVLLFPVVTLVQAFMKVMKVDETPTAPVYGLTDLNNYIKKNVMHSEEEDAEIDAKIFNNAIEFKQVKVRECMIPRTEIVAVDVEDDIEELKAAFMESGHSKIVVYRETIDDVIGYCHSLELFKKPTEIRKILTPIPIIPETMPANELLIQFINERKSLALVVDEFGGTSGIVSMEDVIEEIFGEIRDEHDDEYLVEEQVSQKDFILSARHEIDYLNEKYGWKLPEGDYDTLGGLILSENENIPEVDDVIDIGEYSFQIISKQDNRIDRVKLSSEPSEDSL
jgi:CBS domain containing-hemolysin-like protein